MEQKAFTIKDWSDDDKPREKLMHKGAKHLSDAELLAILIGSGSTKESAVELCKRILASYNNDLDILSNKSIAELNNFRGIGDAKAITILAALELGKRLKFVKQNNTIVTSSKIAYDVLKPILYNLPHEEFWVLFLNNANKVIYKKQISMGGITGTVVDVRIVFKIAIENMAVGLILSHNHPSGKLQASTEDIQLTKKMSEAGKLLDIKVLDHLIIGGESYLSFADEGML